MKREWIRPLTEVQSFVANEYFAACGDSGTTYYFECNAGKKRERYDVVTDGGINLTKDYGLTTNYYHPCNEKHVAASNDDFISGWLYYSDGDDSKINNPRTKREQVIIWTDGGTDVHCTTNLNMDAWETAKS